MYEIRVTIDAGYAALGECGVRLAPGIALGLDCARLMTIAAGAAVPPAQRGEGFRLGRGPSPRPYLRIAVIVRELGNQVTHGELGPGIGFEEQIVRRNVALAAACQNTLRVA